MQDSRCITNDVRLKLAESRPHTVSTYPEKIYNITVLLYRKIQFKFKTFKVVV